MSRLKSKYGVLKRWIDIVGAALLLVIMAPVMLLVALVIMLTSTGPILFIQSRVGKGGRCFDFYKFRTMYHERNDRVNREAEALAARGLLLKLRDDSRVTPIGKFLRRFSLDELPQLYNVLRGDMSLVGPRPLIPFMLEHESKLGRSRSVVKPGLTGEWQVTDRERSTSAAEMWQYDQNYIANPSLRKDARILLKTVVVVLSGKGAK